MSITSRRDDALTIWKAGVAAVDSKRLVRGSIQVEREDLVIAGDRWQATASSRVCVVGAGKAGAGMAAGVEAAFGETWRSRISGWVNVPEDCVTTLRSVHLHGARPAGVNEPTAAGVAGTEEILRLVNSLDEQDLCLVLISGGGSALMPAPIPGITLREKQQVTRTLSTSGATIQELNTVRRALSRVKGGGLLRACKAGRLTALIISDVIGDPLETIASGPTVDVPPDPCAALEVLEKFGIASFPESVVNVLNQNSRRADLRAEKPTTIGSNHIIGNNRTAVESAAEKATALGYEISLAEYDRPGDAAEFGRVFADNCWRQRGNAASGAKLCLISGGEPTVQLAVTNEEQIGGRNQELVLSAAQGLSKVDATGITILSGGTDGEDGPTDAAGAIIDSQYLETAAKMSLAIEDFLSVNNSYRYFESIDGLIKTGPTQTNVMDLRIGLIEKEPDE